MRCEEASMHTLRVVQGELYVHATAAEAEKGARGSKRVNSPLTPSHDSNSRGVTRLDRACLTDSRTARLRVPFNQKARFPELRKDGSERTAAHGENQLQWLPSIKLDSRGDSRRCTSSKMEFSTISTVVHPLIGRQRSQSIKSNVCHHFTRLFLSSRHILRASTVQCRFSTRASS